MIEALLAGLFGLLIGSFLNVCIYRLPRDLSVVRPRSFCPSCEKPIAWYDNVPLLSYAFLRARCRHCGTAIPARYPLVEALTGLAFFLAVLWLGPSVAAAKLCVFSAILIALFFSDLEERILPDEFTLGGAVVGLAFAPFVPVQGLFTMLYSAPGNHRLMSFLDALFAGAFSAGMLWFLGFAYQKLRHREGLGFGDVKMIGMMGVFLGLQGVLAALMLGSTLGAVVGLIYILVMRKDPSTYELPFGTFLAFAALLSAFWGPAMVSWWGKLGG